MSEQLRAALYATGLNQSELARRLGVDQSQVNRWLAGSLNPTARQLSALLQILDSFEATRGLTAEDLGFALVERPIVRRLA